MTNNLTWHDHSVGHDQRAASLGQRPVVIWFTGLSGAGKSTLANALDQALHRLGRHSYLLDGDNVRHGLCADLGFSDADRQENIRRVGELARLMLDAGLFVLTAFVSPFQADRDRVRALLPPGRFIEVHVKADIQTCIRRDPKGLYARAQAGQVQKMTGLDSGYEPPQNPELVLDTELAGVHELVDTVLSYLIEKGFLDAA
ncbi:adenylyl-sulfate kinase [Gallaecimonas sp. GXIMD4217]|uniref:adenylyl-sulfate kinase n=1 Tax=Gallaecimonas sp. GXIMD4217 TaxID=3131927 RepID=UPI00311ADE1B